MDHGRRTYDAFMATFEPVADPTISYEQALITLAYRLPFQLDEQNEADIDRLAEASGQTPFAVEQELTRTLVSIYDAP